MLCFALAGWYYSHLPWRTAADGGGRWTVSASVLLIYPDGPCAFQWVESTVSGLSDPCQRWKRTSSSGPLGRRGHYSDTSGLHMWSVVAVTMNKMESPRGWTVDCGKAYMVKGGVQFSERPDRKTRPIHADTSIIVDASNTCP
ncbi:hypothetical protein K431DRAFT_53971 [Polychaeton citri CBS 116435]|uniref:Uncharacterized protein n=1 Tax=Polychaeton citri CBS 116435 TaxID=1314669 RepID=A0A9P4QHU7_9PEZI|nr:hypothetical protein K431DRAFT_53971 [Polychaeton citri CBS 116435]